jgi:hypothetical protein
MRDMAPRPRKTTATTEREKRARFTEFLPSEKPGKPFHEEHSVLSVQFVVDRAGYALMFSGHMLDLKAHPGVKPDGSGVHGGGNTANHGASKTANAVEKGRVEAASQDHVHDNRDEPQQSGCMPRPHKSGR